MKKTLHQYVCVHAFFRPEQYYVAAKKGGIGVVKYYQMNMERIYWLVLQDQSVTLRIEEGRNYRCQGEGGKEHQGGQNDTEDRAQTCTSRLE